MVRHFMRCGLEQMHTLNTYFSKITQFLEKHPVLSLAIYLALTGNWAFWQALARVSPLFQFHTLLFNISAFVFVMAVTVFLLQLVRYRYVFKPVVVLVLLISASVSYFMNNYGIVIDLEMIHNTMETDSTEVQDLLNIKLLSYLLFLGVLPALLVSRLKLKYKSFPKQLVTNGLVATFALLIVTVNFLLFSADYASLFRNHHELRYMINPANYVYSTGKYISETFKQSGKSYTRIGMDAVQAKKASNSKPNILVLVVGETARAQNFSLNGYNKPTNLLLSKENIINYPHFHSCGTSTHTSLPCMFSHLTRSNFDEADAPYYDNLTDVLSHAGINVLWRDNNSGCKGVCKNINTEKMKHLHIDTVCNDRECYDEVLLDHLQERIGSAHGDMVIVLHQNGSHGPAYYLRYPGNFKKFTPVCESNELSSCDHQSLLNAYDNTIAYTDYFLSRIINLLKTETNKVNTAMIYVSDHGESLGENSIFLHSMPYIVAPEEQTHVPYISWFSNNFLFDSRLNKDCLKQHANDSYSHDNLFHSVLGLMNVSSKIYNESLDMYAACRIKQADSHYANVTSPDIQTN